MSKKFLFVSIFSLSWALNIIINRHLLNQRLAPLFVNFYTMGIALLIFIIYLILFHRISVLPTSKQHWGAFFPESLVGE